jgi:hypothetical protein
MWGDKDPATRRDQVRGDGSRFGMRTTLSPVLFGAMLENSARTLSRLEGRDRMFFDPVRESDVGVLAMPDIGLLTPVIDPAIAGRGGGGRWRGKGEIISFIQSPNQI